MLNRLLYLLKLQNKTLGNGTKNAGEVRGNLSVRKSGNHENCETSNDEFTYSQLANDAGFTLNQIYVNNQQIHFMNYIGYRRSGLDLAS